MFEYKKHIALFFTMLFLASQFAYIGHLLFDSHHNHFEHHIASIKNNQDDIYNAQAKEIFSSNDFYSCLICQQHQSVEFYQVTGFTFKTKNNIVNNNERVNYVNPYFSDNFFILPSLRAPPSVS